MRVSGETLRRCAKGCECNIHAARTLMARELIELKAVVRTACDSLRVEGEPLPEEVLWLEEALR